MNIEYMYATWLKFYAVFLDKITKAIVYAPGVNIYIGNTAKAKLIHITLVVLAYQAIGNTYIHPVYISNFFFIHIAGLKRLGLIRFSEQLIRFKTLIRCKTFCLTVF